MDDLLEVQQLYHKQQNSRPIPAILGNLQGQIPDSDRPGYVLFRCRSSLGLSLPRSAFLPGDARVKLDPGEPILLGFDTDNRLAVLGPNSSGALASGRDTVGTTIRAQSPSTRQSNLETLRLVSKGGLIVSVKSWNIIEHGLYNEVSYPDIDLSLLVPGTDEMRYALIAILKDRSGVEKIGSTPIPVSDLPQPKVDIQECIGLLAPDSTPMWAIKLIGDQTEVLQIQIDNDPSTRDLRQVVNARGDYEYTPSSTADTAGLVGDQAWDDNYEYRKTNAGWKRSALGTF